MFASLLASSCGPAVEISGSLAAAGGADAGTNNALDSDAGVRQRLYDGGPPGDECPQPTLTSIREKVFLAKCSESGCHAAAEPAESLDLTLELAELSARLREAAAQSATGLPLIKANEYGSSYLYLKVFLATPTEGRQMPPDIKLDPCELDAIREWIQVGAPN
jgi:hypothetical protein